MKNKKLLVSLLCLALSPLFTFVGTGVANAAVDTDAPVVNLGVLATIAMSCPSPVTMGSITGTGPSALGSNSTTCKVITNNSAGYKLEWKAGTAAMTNANSDTIAAYTPTSLTVPETWSIAPTASEWGGHLGALSTTPDTTTWGAADTYAGGKWLQVNDAAGYEIIRRTTDTLSSGDNEIIFFGAEVGSGSFQPTGTYTVTVTMTATTL